MDKIRGIFAIFVALFALGIISAILLRPRIEPDPTPTATLAPAVTPVAINDDAQTEAAPFAPPDPRQATPVAPQVTPLFGGGVDLNDGLPRFVCGTTSQGAHLTLVQIQTSRLDIARGFHLGILPFDLGAPIGEASRFALLDSGAIDCAMTTRDAIIINRSTGRVTAIAGETTGAEQLWMRGDLADQLAGKRIAYERGGATERFLRDGLTQLGMGADAVTLLPYGTQVDALAAFASGNADLVAGGEPEILDAGALGGSQLLTPNTYDLTEHVIVVSANALNGRPELVGRFHLAWFDALQQQGESIDAAAARVATWGNATWTGITAADASDDWRAATARFRPLTLADNRLWLRNAESDGLSVDAQFLAQAAQAFPDAAARETTLTISATPNGRTPLTCPPPAIEDNALTQPARDALEACALGPLREDARVSIEIRSGAAWPGPPGAYTAEQVEAAARAKAAYIVDYLVSQGIDPARIEVVPMLPPESRRETTDLAALAQDYFVELALVR
jgi:ABC-type nitrate/sulfonate/bicarbonate transport system substrate-binding protein